MAIWAVGRVGGGGLTAPSLLLTFWTLVRFGAWTTVTGAGTCSRRHQNLSEKDILDALLSNYTKALPEIEGPILVSIELHIQQLSALNELRRDFEIEILFSQLWHDPAFSFDHLTTCKKNITMETKSLQKVWTPNTCLVNSKSCRIHMSPYENSAFILYENGSIWVNNRMQVRAPCDLNLRSFPFDIQRCSMVFKSYSYNSEEVQLRWLDHKPITIMNMDSMELPDFRLVGYSAENDTRQDTNGGDWDSLSVTLLFKRRNGFFVLQAYVPTYLTIIVSWVPFSMKSEIKALPARSTVGVSCLIALTFQIGSIFGNLPRVSYVKAMDVWMLGCITFVFGTIVELAVVCSLNKCTFVQPQRLRSLRRTSAVQTADHSYRFVPVWLWRPGTSSTLDCSNRSATTSPAYSLSYCRNCTSNDSCLVSRGQLQFHRFPSVPHKFCFRLPTPDTVDRLSMLLFPCCFLLFNVFYWWYYLGQAYRQERELIETYHIELIH